MTYHYLNLAGISLGVTDKPVKQFFPRLTVREIQHVVADYYGLRDEDMTSKRQEWIIAHPRQLAMFLARELTNTSYPLIAKLFNKADHTTVIHAMQSVQKRIAADPVVAKDAQNLRERLAR